MAIAEPTEANHVRALDGLRGTAILLVMLYHMTVMQAQGRLDAGFSILMELGWTGVDLFFVLSGFLITGILLRSKDGSAYFRSFWTRRVLRIFPLYYAILIFALLVLPHFDHAKAANFSRIQGDEVWYWVYLQNFTIARHGFRHGILDVTWSLAIEEQFYLLWPVVVLLLSPRRLMQVCVALMAGSLVLRVWLMSLATFPPVSLYVLTFTHMDGLLVGALVATAVHCNNAILPRLLAAPLFWISGVTLAAGCALFVRDWHSWFFQSFGYTVLAVFFGGILVRSLRGGARSPGQAFLESRFMRALGKYSYAMYLFHLPIRAYVRDRLYKPEEFLSIGGSALAGQLIFYAVSIGLTFAAAALSWHLYEKRFLALKRFFPYHAPAPPGP